MSIVTDTARPVNPVNPAALIATNAIQQAAQTLFGYTPKVVTKAASWFPYTEFADNADGSITVSSPSSGNEYTVSADGRTCTCEARVPCWHLAATCIRAALNRGSAAPVAPSTFATATNAARMLSYPHWPDDRDEYAGEHTILIAGVPRCTGCERTRDEWFTTECPACVACAAAVDGEVVA